MNKISNIRPRLTSIAAALLATGIVSGCSNNSSPAPADLFTLLAQGGAGGQDGGSGGSGGEDFSDKEGVGDAEFSNVDQVAVGFTPTAIASLTIDLGSNPLMVTSDTTMVEVALGDPRPATAGTAYQVTNDSSVYLSPGSGIVPPTGETEDRVTGIDVAAGVQLTLALSYFGETSIDVANDVNNAGEITTEDSSVTQRGDLNITSGRYIATGTLTTFGTLDGQSGGDINVNAQYAAHNSGDMLAYGADSTEIATAAGNGGSIDLYGDFVNENTGRLASYGGAATDGAGGNGGTINFRANFGAGNSGAFDTYGGIGITVGGSGGYIILDVRTGGLKNTGALSSYGANADPGNGGSGGYVSLTGATGGLEQNSTILSYGGDSAGVAGNGGSGGYVNMEADDQDFIGAYDDRAPGNMAISGNIDTRGGNALATGTGDGGRAGSVNFDLAARDRPQTPSTIALRGYASFNTSGGDGNFGGNAGDVTNRVEEEQADNSIDYAGGNVTNRVSIIARGGNVVAGGTSLTSSAGNGGSFTLETAYQLGFESDSMDTLNTATVDLSAGTGTVDTNTGASGGSVYLWGYTSSQNTGDITSNGGSDAGTNGGTDGVGGVGGDVVVLTEMGAASNTGALTINGGAGEYRGGRAGYVGIVGYNGASNAADITGNGGDADPSLDGSIGGSGSYIGLTSRPGTIAASSGTLTYNRGLGETNGIGGALATNGTCTGDGCARPSLP